MSGYLDALSGRMTCATYFDEHSKSQDARFRQISQSIGRTLWDSEIFYVSPSISEILTDSAQALPHNARLESVDDLPFALGFVWLATPFTLSETAVSIRGNHCNLRAFSWCPNTEPKDGGQSYLQIFTFEEEEDYRGFPGVTGAQHWPWQTPLNEVTFNPLRQDEPANSEDARRIYALLYTFFEFIRSPIFETVIPSIPRPLRRRWTHRVEPSVRVIQLRERKTSGVHEGKEIEWQHRWVVSRHWRQQWYPSLNQHLPKLIAPYLKGPSDKPLKPPRARVFAVVR